MLFRSLLSHGQIRFPDMPPIAMPEVHQEILSAREIEVLVLITKGLINKEIADKLNISLTTVITHRIAIYSLRTFIMNGACRIKIV